MSGALLYRGGIPTAPDVQKIVENIEVEVGQVIPYTMLEQILHESRDTSRFKTVVHSWRNRMFRELNVIMDAVPNVGLKVLDNHERVNYSSRKIKHGFRRIRKGSIIAAKTSRAGLKPDEVKSLDHIGSIDAAIRLATANAAKQLEMPDPVVKKK